ncbi:LysR family transcriptional regulator [Ancylobacter sp. 6x-1]|uniref:LysR family transcriptional regulator n=1 Tax=Ancylobacter crimeensis TaxID=2579147 RepID=A0ABT0D8F2_9HYPH|nr:LysR family transcriptional regulator [Ancylobacter crimeensis]MCK0196225.1 LysR family transcriptional regulator [Ancylobacter crimeensis]
MARIDQDRMFVAVLDLGSFAAAARRLGTSSGQASKLVAQLEAELGVQLLKRTTRALAPTEVGQAYYDRIRVLLEEFDALDASVRTASAQPAGRLRLTAPASFGTTQLVPRLIGFARDFPQIELDVSFTDRVVNLIDEGFDAALRIGRAGDSSLIARKLCESRVVMVAAPAYAARSGLPARPETLAGHACIIDTNFPDPLNWRLRPDPSGEILAVPVVGRLRFANAEACLAAAEAGLGIARVPSFIAGESLRAGRVVPVLRGMAPEVHGVFAVYPPARHLAGKVRALVDHLVRSFHGEPEWDQGW